jgi:hypothetical protein
MIVSAIERLVGFLFALSFLLYGAYIFVID